MPTMSPGFALADYANRDEEEEKLPALGAVHFFEASGVWAKVVQVHTACISDGTADVIRSGDVLYQMATTNIVTNDRSEAVTDTPDAFAGVAPQLTANVPESTSTAIYYMWMILKVKGTRATVRTNGDDDIVAGNFVVASGDGTCDSVAVGSESAQNINEARLIGKAAAADSDSANTVSVDFS